MRKYLKPAMAAFMLLFAILGISGVVAFDVVLPVVVLGTAFVTYVDAKRAAREGREGEARSLMNVFIFMLVLVMLYFFTKKI